MNTRVCAVSLYQAETPLNFNHTAVNYHYPGYLLTISRSEIHQGTGASLKVLSNR